VTNPSNRFRDAALRHAVHTYRYARGRTLEAQRAVDRDLFPDLLGRITTDLGRIGRRGPGAAPWDTRRYQSMVGRVDKVLDEFFADRRREQSAELRDLARVQARWMQEAAARSGVDLELPDLRRIVAVAGEPMAGRTLDEWWASAGDDLRRRIRSEIAQGLAAGETDEQVLARVRRQWDRTQTHAEAITRTAVGHVAVQAQQRVAQANGDRVRGIVWMATLEPNTCPICWSRHGRTWRLDRGPRPPAHPNCRCQAVLLFSGVATPDLVDADEFLSEQSAEWQDEALGATRARLFRAGRIGVRDLTNRLGRPLRLDELEERVRREAAG